METRNTFDKRNNEKQKIHFNKTKNVAHPIPKEIWYIKMGQNVGYEENGKDDFVRPVLVIRKMGNLYFCIAMTSQGKSENIFYYELESIKFGNKKSSIILSQGRTYDAKRFGRCIGKVSQEEFIKIKKLIKDRYLGRVF